MVGGAAGGSGGASGLAGGMPSPMAALEAGRGSPGGTTAASSAGASGIEGAAVGGSGAGSAGQLSPPSAAGAGAGAPASATPVTVYIAGDSTVSTYRDTASPSDQAGWGQMLHEHVRDKVMIENRAVGGRTARRFIDDGTLDEIWEQIQAGDYLLVQFGTNDGNRSATYTYQGQTIPYYLDPATDFKTYLKMYSDGARKHGAIPVFVTPPPRNSAYCTGGNGTGAHAQAMRELAASEQVLLSDLNERSVSYLKAICPAPSPPDFYLQKPDGSVDGTHFQEQGARKLAELVADGLREAGVSWVK